MESCEAINDLITDILTRVVSICEENSCQLSDGQSFDRKADVSECFYGSPDGVKTMQNSHKRYHKHKRVHSDPVTPQFVPLTTNKADLINFNKQSLLFSDINQGSDEVNCVSSQLSNNGNQLKGHSDYFLCTNSESWRLAQERLIRARLHDLEVSRELERENMHLYLSEMLIAAVEQMKWRSVIGAQENVVLIGKGPQNRVRRRRNSTSGLGTSIQQARDNLSSDSGGSSLMRNQEGEDWYPESECSYAAASSEHSAVALPNQESSKFYPCKKKEEEEEQEDSLSVGNRKLMVDFETEKNSFCDDKDPNSAEAIAASLLRHFSTKHSVHKDWLVSFADAPQLLLPMPTDVFVPSDEVSSMDSSKKILLRGTFDWAPPRKQWIFTLHDRPVKLKLLLDKQKFRCAGCGLKLDKKVYARRVRYCDYFGRFFCQCCHQGAKTFVPARILHQWNFREYPVSDLAHRFLTESKNQPVIDVEAISPKLYAKIRSMRHIREKRSRLVHMWQYVKTCRWTGDVVTNTGNLKAMFTGLPSHWLSSVDVFSLGDLEMVHSAQIVDILMPVLNYAKQHIEGCEHCQAKAFVCEYCEKKDLLFPFQLDKVDRCQSCGSLAHTKCVRSRRSVCCPKCVRIERRRLRQISTGSTGPSLSISSPDRAEEEREEQQGSFVVADDLHSASK